MTPPSIDLDAYLRRIGYDGPREPTLPVLAALQRCHVQAIAFENLSPLLGVPVSLDADALEAKMIRGGRGGWCFEQNHLFGHALGQLGFAWTGLAARVRRDVPEEVVTARGHMLLLVEVPEGPHVADVGFGGMTATGPLRLADEEPQPTPHERFRIRPVGGGGDRMVEVELGGAWQPLYRFDLQRQERPDYEVTSWYLSTSPRSPFISNLIASRPAPGCRHALRGGVLRTHRIGGPSEEQLLTSPDEVRRALEDVFGLTLPEGAALEAALEAAAQVGRDRASAR